MNLQQIIALIQGVPGTFSAIVDEALKVGSDPATAIKNAANEMKNVAKCLRDTANVVDCVADAAIKVVDTIMDVMSGHPQQPKQ
jgi:hypothetical protein